MKRAKNLKDLRGENPSAFLCTGFFVLDYETGKNVYQIDYCIRKKKKIASFILGDELKLKIENLLNKKGIYKSKKIDSKTRIDLKMLKKMVEEEIKKLTINGEIKKIIAVIIPMEKEKIWNLNCILSNFDVLKIKIEDETKKFLEIQKFNLFSFVKKV